MSKVKLRNDLIVSILLLILVFSISSSISLVQADAGGTGKYLGIVFKAIDTEDDDALRDSACYVIATKETSGQQFIFNATDDTDHLSDGTPVSLEKVAAGTVILTAHPSEGWIFLGFNYYDDGAWGDNNSYYKTEKYGTVEAIFDEIETVDITVSILTEFVASDGGIYELGFGSIFYEDDKIVSTDSGFPLSTTVTVPYSSTPTFNFVASDGNDLSCVIVSEEGEGGSTYYADFIETVLGEGYQYQFPPVEKNLALDAIFYSDGEAFIPGGNGVTVFLRDQEQDVGLSFLGTVGTGVSSGIYIATGFDPNDVVVWEITVSADLGDDLVLIALVYPEGISNPEDLRIYRGDSELAACDFDADGKITGRDVSDVANAVDGDLSTYDPKFDVYPPLSPDGDINSDDVNYINDLIGSKVSWEDITSPYIGDLPAGAPEGLVYPVDTDNNIVYGFTDHFSIFRGR